MRLREMAEAFAELERTSARGRMVELVARLLRRARPDEREPLVYLLLGELRPPYEGVTMGVGEKLLVAALAQAYATTPAAVQRLFKRVGDLGLVAERLAPVEQGSRLRVGDAYGRLLAVARTSGVGAIQGKIALLIELLHAVGPLEAKYVIRAAQGRLRLGVGEQTILEAAAIAALGDHGAKALLEHAFNVRSDLGGIVVLAFDGGRRALARIGPRLGVPVRPALAQRLPSAAAIIERLGPVQAEPKYDGFRIQLHRDGDVVRAFSRRLEDVSEMFPELAAGLRRQLRSRRAIVEGEAVVHDPKTGEFLPFQVTMTRKRKTRIAESAARHPLRFFAFDLLYVGGRSYLERPQCQRTARLRALLPFRARDAIAVTDAVAARTAGDLQAYFDEMLAHGLEGVVAKRPDAPYRPGARGFDWVKLKRSYESKLRDTVDLVIVGYLRGRGKRAALGIGSLLGAVYDPKGDRFCTVAKIGSGPSEQEWKELRRRLDQERRPTKPARVDSRITPDVWIEPKYVVEVIADEITRSPFHTCGRVAGQPGYALRFPRMVGGIRADKGAEEASTVREILELFRMQ